MPDRFIRVGDKERDEAIEMLAEHLSLGRLSLEEHSERSDQVLSAKTQQEIDQAFFDLPSPTPMSFQMQKQLAPIETSNSKSKFSTALARGLYAAFLSLVLGLALVYDGYLWAVLYISIFIGLFFSLKSKYKSNFTIQSSFKEEQRRGIENALRAGDLRSAALIVSRAKGISYDRALRIVTMYRKHWEL